MRPTLAAALDYALLQVRAPRADAGPFNGQRARANLVRALVAEFHFAACIETGTYFGATTAFLAEVSGAPVYTVEFSLRQYLAARLRLRRSARIHCVFGDSRAFLKRLAADPRVPKTNTFAYLDAHWAQHDLPLHDELEIILAHWQSAVIMIDDFRVPADDGYGYDRYQTTVLAAELLAPFRSRGIQLFFPRTASAQETGRRRGCVVLAHGAGVAARLTALGLLRPAENLSGYPDRS